MCSGERLTKRTNSNPGSKERFCQKEGGGQQPVRTPINRRQEDSALLMNRMEPVLKSDCSEEGKKEEEMEELDASNGYRHQYNLRNQRFSEKIPECTAELQSHQAATSQRSVSSRDSNSSPKISHSDSSASTTTDESWDRSQVQDDNLCWIQEYKFGYLPEKRTVTTATRTLTTSQTRPPHLKREGKPSICEKIVSAFSSLCPCLRRKEKNLLKRRPTPPKTTTTPQQQK
ncbi:uncharacterized protein isoform X2 [Takifugu rubripes]|uniref:uncharacterized protein isoform X2 n=1 Tax=Takifugu rubripes TaxID=31033 RepID=UPI0011457F8D|nr:uncharacterized protein LOC115246871 isoform X2 [Takifugu rubripes]